MEKKSELINDREKLLQTFEYVLILENKCNELNNKLNDYNKIKKQLKSCRRLSSKSNMELRLR